MHYNLPQHCKHLTTSIHCRLNFRIVYFNLMIFFEFLSFHFIFSSIVNKLEFNEWNSSERNFFYEKFLSKDSIVLSCVYERFFILFSCCFICLLIFGWFLAFLFCMNFGFFSSIQGLADQYTLGYTLSQGLF